MEEAAEEVDPGIEETTKNICIKGEKRTTGLSTHLQVSTRQSMAFLQCLLPTWAVDPQPDRLSSHPEDLNSPCRLDKVEMEDNKVFQYLQRPERLVIIITVMGAEGLHHHDQ